MKTRFLFCALILSILLMTGCTPKGVATHGFSSPEESLSIPHPVEYEKKGEEYITLFPAILDPGLWGVEGFSFEGLDIGVFPVLTNSASVKGYAIITESNFWADQIMQVMLVGKKSDIEKVIYLSRDGHTAYDVTGKELKYDSERFDESSYHQSFFAEVGMSIQEIESFWKKYSNSRGIDIPSGFQFVEEIKIGSDRWEEFKFELATRLTNNYKMSSGEIRQGYISLDEFRKEASKNNGTTPGQRFSRNVFVPATVEPVTLVVGTVGSLLNGLIKASSGSVEGFYSMAEGQRGDLKTRFREMSGNFKRLLMERDRIIYELQAKR